MSNFIEGKKIRSEPRSPDIGDAGHSTAIQDCFVTHLTQTNRSKSRKHFPYYYYLLILLYIVVIIFFEFFSY
jgi:uncharacterized membrane protein